MQVDDSLMVSSQQGQFFPFMTEWNVWLKNYVHFVPPFPVPYSMHISESLSRLLHVHLQKQS